MHQKTKTHFIFLLQLFIAVIFILPAYLVVIRQARADTITDMSQQIDAKKDDIEELQGKLLLYQGKIKEAKKQANTLNSELSILEDEITKSEIDIQITEQQIQKTELEIQKINLEIDAQEKQVVIQKKRLSEYVRTLYQNDDVHYMEVLVMNDSFSDFFDHYKYLENLQNSVKNTLHDLKSMKAELDIQKKTLEDKRKREGELHSDLQVEKTEYESRAMQKETLLKETRRSESKFQSYVAELKREQNAINNEIISLERKIRAELERQTKEERFKELGPVRLQWPIESRRITAYFHDPDYPYRNIFEHPAVDISSPQGTQVHAAESGYVAKVQDGGMKGYSYIMILHSDNISTVYGHVSAIYVKANEYVNKGDVIGLSGGKPGTRGAGRLTTGSHLHLEVRKNGVPINPLDYLP